MYHNILVIGGTGMLSKACYELAQQSHVFTSVARTKHSLSRLDDMLDGVQTEHHMINLNWDNRAIFIGSLQHHLNWVGLPDLVLTWLHDGSLAQDLFSLFENSGKQVTFYQVLGSSAANPERQVEDLFHGVPGHIDYRQIILGFKTESNRSRWLGNDEISSGIITAMKSNEKQFIVGQVSPWSKRP